MIFKSQNIDEENISSSSEDFFTINMSEDGQKNLERIK